MPTRLQSNSRDLKSVRRRSVRRGASLPSSDASKRRHWTNRIAFRHFAECGELHNYYPRPVSTEEMLKVVLDALSRLPTSVAKVDLADCHEDSIQGALGYFLLVAENAARSYGGEFGVYRNNKGKATAFIVNSACGLTNHVVFELRPIWELRKTNKYLFAVLASITHYLLNVLPTTYDYLELIDPANIYEPDEQEDDSQLINGIAEYVNGTPRAAFEYFRSMRRPKTLEQIRKYAKTTHPELSNWLIEMADVLDGISPIVDKGIEMDDGLQFSQYVYCTWDLNHVVDKNYHQLLDNTGNDYGGTEPTDAVEIQSQGWVAPYQYGKWETLVSLLEHLNKRETSLYDHTK